jgi:outer membrane lipopolysaccharide assembly protein LptE/RlpB
VTASDAATRRHGDAGAGSPHRVSLAPRPRVRSLVAIAVSVGTVFLTMTRCGYSLIGRTSTLPPSVRVIHFQTLANQTPRVGVEQRLSREIARELASRGRFSVRPESAGADADLAGAVTGFSLFPVAFDEAGRAREYQVRITAQVSLKTLPEGKVLWENPAYTFQENYTFATSAVSYIDRENEAIDRVSERFAASLVSSLLEGF